MRINVATYGYIWKTAGLGSMAADRLQRDLRFLFEKRRAAVAKPSWSTLAGLEDSFRSCVCP